MFRSARAASLLIATLFAVLGLALPTAASAAGLTVAFTAKPAVIDDSRAGTFRWTVKQGRVAATGVTLTCKLDGKLLKGCTSPKLVTASADGKHTLSVSASKRVSPTRLLTGAASFTWTVDTRAPGRPILSGALDGWSAAPQTITANDVAETGSGIARYESQVSADGSTWGDLRVGFQRTVATSGQSQVRFRAVDRAGNAGAYVPVTVRIDDAAPALPTVSGGSTAWLSQASTTLTASSTDSQSGIARLEYQTSTDGGTIWSAESAGATVTIASEGSTVVRFRAIDAVGRTSAFTTPTAATTVRLDRTAPAAPSVTGGNGPATWAVALGLDIVAAALDATSGVVDYQTRTSTDGGTTWTPFTSVGILGRLGVSAEARTLVEFRAIDAAGNVGTSSAFGNTSQALLDRTAPAVPTITAPVGPIDGTHLIVGTSSDSLSGVASVVVTWQGASGSGTLCTLTAGLASWTCSWNTDTFAAGAYAITATATDRAGNTNTDTRFITVAAAAIVVTETASATAVTEGGAPDTYTVRLATQPTSSVVVSTTPGAGITATPATLTFTPANWATAQTVTVTAIDDSVDETSPANVAVAHATTTTDATYSLLTASVTASVSDNDTAGIEFADSVDVAESGGSDTYTVRLTSQPTAAVDVALAGSQVGATPSPLTFTSATWNVWQTVTVTALDDSVDETSTVGAIVHDAGSTDPFYAALANATHPANVADNDTAGVLLSQSARSVTEGAAGATYTVVLGSEPTADVTVTVNDPAQADVSPATLTFTAADWDDAQTVTVTATDDAIDEVVTNETLTHSIDSADAIYDVVSVGSIALSVADNDVAGVTRSSMTAIATEGGATGSYTLRLNSEPTSDVTIAVTDGAETNASPSTLTFTAANWNTAQTVTVTAENDSIDEDDEVENVTHSATSADSFYNLLPVGAVTVTVTDNDDSALVLSALVATATEGGATGSYTVKLATKPSEDTVVTVAGGPQASASPSTLTFTSGNWDTVQTVTITAVNDDVDENSHVQNVTNEVTSGDARYDVLPAASVVTTVTDNDDSSVQITQSGGTTTVVEAGATDSYDVVLTSMPSATVTVTLSHDADVTLSDTTLTFLPAAWNVAQTVTVTAVNDTDPEGSVPSLITHAATSADGLYVIPAIGTVSALVVDNDVSYLVVESTGTTAVTEGGATDTVDVRLSTQPLSNVVVGVTTDNQVDTAPASLTFTPANWATAQTLTITATNDNVDEDAGATHPGVTTLDAVSGDANYDTLALRTITAAVTDDDLRGVTVTGTPVVVNEAGTTQDTYQVVLDSAPTAPVTVALTGAQVSTSANLLFDDTNWNVAQDVTVTALQDLIDEADPHAGAVSYAISGGDYGAVTEAATSVDVGDNDTAGYELLGAVDVTEGTGSDTYTVRLTSQPTDTVTVALAGTQVGATPTPLTFTTGDWNSTQTVTVTATNDVVDEGAHAGSVAHDASSTDPIYQNLAIASHPASITDNDVAGVTITPSGTTDVTEGTGTDSYDVVLDTKPTADVTITVTDGAQLDATPTTLTFTDTSWNVAKTVTVSATDDAVDEGAHTGSITHAIDSADLKYDVLSVGGVVASITDNDTRGFQIAESLGSTDVIEGGATDAYDIRLTSQPTSDTTVTVSGGAQASAAPSTLIFTTTNWDSYQTVTVTAVNDVIDEATNTQLVVNDATAGDAGYVALANATVIANVTDNDVAAVNVTHSGGTSSVIEGGAGDTFDVVLATQPTADVTVTPSAGSADVTTSTGVLTFTPATWNTPQSVSIAAVDDLVDEASPEASSIALTVASATDTFYDAPAVDTTAAVSVLDDDVRGLAIVESGGSTSVNEAGATTDTYTVQLTSMPTATVTVTTIGDQVLASGPLTFAPGAWNVAQTVTVTAVDDDADEAATHAGSVAYTVTGGDYAGLAAAPTTVTVSDDDIAGFTVVESLGTTIVNENGGVDSYTIALNSQPTSNVVVAITSSNPDLVRTPATLTFTDVNWATPQAVTLSTPNDVTPEGPELGTLSHTVTGDAQYVALPVPASVVASIEDNDHAVLVSPVGISVSETGTTSASYAVVLTTAPSQPVTVAITTDSAQVTSSVPSVTFNGTNWSVAKNVTITAVDDAVDEAATHTSSVTHATTSADLNYHGLATPAVTASISDDDTAGVVITESTGTAVTEGTGTDTYDVRLASEPTANVVLTLDDGDQVSASAATLTFTPADWDLDQTVTVTAVDDLVDESATHPGVIAHTSASTDPNYQPLTVGSVNVTVTDNDTRGVTIVEAGGSTAVNEAGTTTDTYTVRLNTEPTATVTVALTGSQVGVTTPLTFTTADWMTPKTVTVTALDDAIDEADPHAGSVAHALTGGDYAGFSVPNVAVAVSDNDTAGYTVTDAVGTRTEGATGAYTLRLTSEPVGTVVITPSTNADYSVSPASVTFDNTNWNVDQVLTFTAVDDSIDEADGDVHAISFGITGTATGFPSLANSSITVNDNDVAGFLRVGNGTVAVAEQGTTSDTYTVQLATQPTSDVTVALTGDLDVSVSPSTLTFTSSTWATPQTVTVTATQDTGAEGPHTGTITHTVTSSDTFYDEFVLTDVTATVADNDGAVFITEAGGTLVDEAAGGSDTYTVVLSSEPAANVTVTVNPDAQVSATPLTLTFTPTNWHVAQTVTVDGVNDEFAEAATHPGVVTHTSASTDPSYQALTIPSVTASVTDNDSVGVTVTPTSLGVTEGAVGTTYEVVLTSRPTGTVTVSPTAVGDDVVASPATLTFAPGAWATPQTVTVTAVNDDYAEGAHSDTVTNDASSADTAYDSLVVPSVTANVTDNDVSGVIVVESTGTTNVTEGGSSDTYTVHLSSRPTADVTVAISGSQVDATLSSSTLTFTTTNWASDQTVTVTAVNDQVDEDAEITTFEHSATSADDTYDVVTGADVEVSVADNDTAGVTISKANVLVDENGLQDTYTVRLTSEPTDDVTITVDETTDEAVATPSTLTFTSANWSSTQTVTVSAVDDPAADGTLTDTLTHAAASVDGKYAGIPIATVTAHVESNDPDIVASASAVTVGEGSTVTYTVSLKSEPTENVTVTPVSGDTSQVTVSGALVFTGANWATPQTVTVTSVPDSIDETDPVVSVSHTVSSLDANYNVQTLVPTVVTVTDDDTRGITLVNSTGRSVVEGQSITYTVVLDSMPTGPVTITLGHDAQLAVTDTLDFTAANWNMLQTVTVTGIADGIADAGPSSITYTVAGGDYAGFILAPTTVDVADV